MGYSVHLATSFVDFTHLSHVSAYYETLRARPAFQRSLGSRKGQAPAKETLLMTEPTLFIPQIAAATTGAIVILNVILMILWVGSGRDEYQLGRRRSKRPSYRAIRPRQSGRERRPDARRSVPIGGAHGPTVYARVCACS